MKILPVVSSIIGQSPSQPPATPTGLMLTAVDQATISGAFNSVPTATYYEYKTAESVVALGDAGWQRIMAGTAFTVQNLKPSTEYFAVVRAGNDAGTSAPSASVSVTTQSAPVTTGVVSENYNDYTYLGSIVNIGEAESPTVDIIVPDVSESPTQRVWSIGFLWSLVVVGFKDTDAIISGEDAPLTMFSGKDRDYSAVITLPLNTKGTVTITVKADSVSTPDGVVGPPEDVSVDIPFDTRPKTPVQNISCVRTLTNTLNNDLGLGLGGVFRNVLSAAKLENYIYCVCQIQRHGGLFGSTSPTTGGQLTFLDDGATIYIQAGAVLYRINTSTCAFQIIKRYKNVTKAARSLVAHEGRMYGIEGSHYAHLNDGLVNDYTNGIQNYQRGRFRDVDENWKRDCGNLFSIANTESEITQHGIITSAVPQDNPFFDAADPDAFYGIHTGSASPLASETGGVTGVLGYGNYDEVTDKDAASEVSRYKNIAWVSLNTNLNRKIPVLATNNRSAFEIIAEIARVTNSIIYFDGESFILKPRDVADDAEPDHKLKLNALSLEQPIDEITVYNDLANLWNAIEITYANNKVFRKNIPEAVARDKQKRVYAMRIGLDDSNLDWIKWIADSFLARFSVPRNIVVCQLKPSPHLRRGKVIEIEAPDRVYLSGKYQVIEATHLILENRSEVRFVSL